MSKLKFQRIQPIIFSIVILCLVGLSFVVLPDRTLDTAQKQPQAGADCSGLKYIGKCFPMELADNNQERIQGLSGRDGLPDGSGMLFVFENPQEQCFWMKDMRFSLDIIWTNEQKQIIKIEKNVSPQTYPKSFCAPETKYVLEFDAGFIDQHGLKAKEALKF